MESEGDAVTKELFSVIILCYRHFEYLYSAIDSVLEQDYPNIELIISDDSSPKFPRKRLEQYIEDHRRENIVRVMIRQEESNVGTVRHLNHAVQSCSGSYVIALAGDDNLWDNAVLNRYVKGFSHAPENCFIEMAQTAMYDESLKRLESFYLKPAVRAALEKTETDTEDLKRLLVRNLACLPSTSTCFRWEFFQKFGSFDEHYTLIEDYPMHMRLAEEKWIIHYENFVAVKHRHGGVSHGQTQSSTQTSMLYYQDTVRMIKEIVLPNIGCLLAEDQRMTLKKCKADLLWLDMKIAKVKKDYRKLAVIACCHPFKAYWWFAEKCWPFLYAWHIKPLLLCLAMWAGIPVISEMLALAFGVAADTLLIPLYTAAAIFFIVWVIVFLMWGSVFLRWKLLRYPNEVIVIG